MSNGGETHRGRSLILFTTGLAGIIYVTIADGTDRPTLLILFAAMVGLPAFLRLDEHRRNGDDKK